MKLTSFRNGSCGCLQAWFAFRLGKSTAQSFSNLTQSYFFFRVTNDKLFTSSFTCYIFARICNMYMQLTSVNCKLLIFNHGYWKSFRSSFLKLKVTEIAGFASFISVNMLISFHF